MSAEAETNGGLGEEPAGAAGGEAIMAKIAAGEFDAEEAAETPATEEATEVAMEVSTDKVEEKAAETEVKEEEAKPGPAAEPVEVKVEDAKVEKANYFFFLQFSNSGDWLRGIQEEVFHRVAQR